MEGEAKKLIGRRTMKVEMKKKHQERRMTGRMKGEDDKDVERRMRDGGDNEGNEG